MMGTCGTNLTGGAADFCASAGFCAIASAPTISGFEADGMGNRLAEFSFVFSGSSTDCMGSVRLATAIAGLLCPEIRSPGLTFTAEPGLDPRPAKYDGRRAGVLLMCNLLAHNRIFAVNRPSI